MAREAIQHLVDFRESRTFHRAAEKDLVAIIVAVRIELEGARTHIIALPVRTHSVQVRRDCDTDAREYACKLLDIPLGVASVRAERMQLHQLARVVLVESFAAFCALSR